MTPWLNGAMASKPDGERSTTWGGPAASRSSTTQVMVVPLAMTIYFSTLRYSLLDADKRALTFSAEVEERVHREDVQVTFKPRE